MTKMNNKCYELILIFVPFTSNVKFEICTKQVMAAFVEIADDNRLFIESCFLRRMLLQ